MTIQMTGKVGQFIQPITDDILGARGSETIFHIPKETGSLINSTDAELSLQEGLIVPSMVYPAIFMDSFIDSGTSNTAFESFSSMSMGRSTVTTSTNHYSQMLIQVDWSSLPIPGTYEFTEAYMTLYKLSGGITNQENVTVAICEVSDDWNESVTFNNPTGAGSSWSSSKCDTPFEVTEISYNDASIEFDITYAVQHAHSSGSDKVNLMFYIASDTSDRWEFASSDHTADESRRPILDLTWRTGNQWLPTASTGLAPLDDSTLWNTSSSQPTGVDSVSLNWTNGISNGTTWWLQLSRTIDFTGNDTLIVDLDDVNSSQGTWDEQNKTFTFADNTSWGDYWTYWRVRADQGHRLGKWSDVNSFRVPGTLGVSDGSGNVTVNLYQGAIFVDSGNLPNIPDAMIDSNQASSNLDSTNHLTLGISETGTGESRILIEFDLSEIPFPAAMTPTNALLSLERFNVTGTSSLTVSAHACNSFTETSVTWNNSPSCSSSEITRSTLLVSQSTTQIWDITSLAQSNIANGNTTLTVMLKAVGTPGSSHKFYDNSAQSIDNRPNLTLEYVDNVNGIIPPGQPTLNYPADGAVLYNNTEWVLTPMDKPQLTWNSVADATGYIVTISDGNNQFRYNSAGSSQISGTT
ncbi:MAG: DNRLRE domain-containing protein, partial [Euryarchaeota archaeon]